MIESHLRTDDWNKMVVKSKFKDWESFLNARWVDRKGYIGLKDHGDDVRYRNIKIKRL